MSRFTEAINRFRPGATAQAVKTVKQMNDDEALAAKLYKWATEAEVEETVIPLLTERSLEADARADGHMGTPEGHAALGEKRAYRWLIDNLDAWAQRTEG